MDGNFAIFRLPHDNSCTMVRQTQGLPTALSSCHELTDVEGFVFAPFAISAEHPVYVLKPDVIETAQLSDAEDIIGCDIKCESVSSERSVYADDFAAFHEKLLSGDFKKIVLARRNDVSCADDIQPMALFRKACRMYPRMFVSLISTSLTGTWLMATPEILLEGVGRRWHTMALAGTMKVEEDKVLSDCAAGNVDEINKEWSKKNIEEQRVVARYISGCLERYADEIDEKGPYTVRAGNVVHLRSDFNLMLHDGKDIGRLIEELHPTPAVCGFPKAETFDFIVENEHCRRSFYSGFAGPMFKNATSHLFVSLRCMHIDGHKYSLYAGGGLLSDSVEQQEWEETEAKLDTMKALFR